MRYFISVNFKNLSLNWREKYVFHREKWNSEPTAETPSFVNEFG